MSREENRRRTGKYGYLQDYNLTVDGEAIYTGWLYTARLERAIHRKKLNVAVCAALLSAILFVVPGFLPLHGLLSEKYVLLPYALTIVVAVRVGFASVRLRVLKEPIRIFEFERTYTVMSQWSVVAVIPAAATIVATIYRMTHSGADALCIVSCLFMLMGSLCEVFLWRLAKGIKYSESRATGNEL